MTEQLRRIGFSIGTSLFLFWRWWIAFDGAYTQSDVLWITVVSIALAVGIYLFLPLGRKVKTFSLTSFIFLVATIHLIYDGLIGIDYLDIDEGSFSISFIAWGEYKLYFGLWISVIYIASKFYYRPNLWSPSALFERINLDETRKGESTI